MFQHIDSDDEEDDYEGYFLRPVNGYKISEKIISANKELFDENINPPAPPSTEIIQLNGKNDQKHVTFRTELEDFEPDIFTEDYYNLDEDEEVEDEQQYEESDIIPDDVLPLDSENCVVNLTNMNKNIKNSDSNNDCVVKDIDEICEEIEEVILTKLSYETEELSNKNVDDDRFSSLTDDSLDANSVIASPISPIPILTNSTIVTTTNICNNDKLLPKLIDTPKRPLKSNPSITTNNSMTAPIKSLNNDNVIDNSDLPKIQLNFKPCCEHKYYENDKLPRYSGYLSQYGLSKEQLERRNVQHERLHQKRCISSAKKIEENSMKSQVNEQAFARWLRNKMRNSRSLTRNMYDYVPTAMVTSTAATTAKIKNKRQSGGSAVASGLKQKKSVI